MATVTVENLSLVNNAASPGKLIWIYLHVVFVHVGFHFFIGHVLFQAQVDMGELDDVLSRCESGCRK